MTINKVLKGLLKRPVILIIEAYLSLVDAYLSSGQSEPLDENEARQNAELFLTSSIMRAKINAIKEGLRR